MISGSPRLTWNFSDCSVAMRFVFLTQQQRLNCVDVFLSVTFTFIQIFDQNFVFFTERRQSWRICLMTASKFALFSVSGLKHEKLIKKQTYMKSETCKLYSGAFWIFLPNIMEIDPYNFHLYRFKVGSILRHSVVTALIYPDRSKSYLVRLQ